MPDKKYDAVIVGGGHHATIIACYLQRQASRRPCSRDGTKWAAAHAARSCRCPGFIQNPCAHFTRFYTHPAYGDFNLREYGLVYLFPEYNEAWIYPNGNYILGKTIFHVVDPYTGQGRILRGGRPVHGQRDWKVQQGRCQHGRRHYTKYKNKWRTAFGKYRYTGPGEWGDKPIPLEELFDDPKNGLDPNIALGTVGQIATELFKSPEMQTFYMRAMQTSNGLFPADRPGPYWHIHALGLIFSMDAAAIVIGGTHCITHAFSGPLRITAASSSF